LWQFCAVLPPVGGPALAGYNSEIGTALIEHCGTTNTPLDFFSWHCYTGDSGEPAARARAIRRLLDDYGFRNTESHLNEWNFLPGNSWQPVSRSAAPETRHRFYEQMAGAAGGAFIVAALLELQDAPVNVCNLFHGELGGFGLFSDQGVPQQNYYALRAFSELLDAPQRVETRGGVSGQLAVVAGLNRTATSAAILVSNFAASDLDFDLTVTNLPWAGQTVVETRRVNASETLDFVTRQTNDTSPFSISLELKKPAVALIRLRPRAAPRSYTFPGNTKVPARRLRE